MGLIQGANWRSWHQFQPMRAKSQQQMVGQKNQDLAPAWTISIRSVFLAQSHQICGSELENASGGEGVPFPPTLEGLCGRTLKIELIS